MPADIVVSFKALYELHKEWDELVARREAVLTGPYDPCAEADLVFRLERHHEKLLSMREAIIRQSLDDCDADLVMTGARGRTN